MAPVDMTNIFYQFHMYEPFEYTHQKVLPQFKDVVAAYPDDAKGWNAAGLRRIIEPVIAFERRFGAHIFVGEFSAIAYAEGCGQWIADVVEMLNECRWDWCYHAFREWPGWSVEHVVTKGDSASNAKFAPLLPAFAESNRDEPDYPSYEDEEPYDDTGGDGLWRCAAWCREGHGPGRTRGMAFHRDSPYQSRQ